MATLVLTAIGSALGGPIGGAIGSAIGQYVDRTLLFAPKPRHGPRLGDLAVQTSFYGTEIPKIFGRLRVAGTVIWATDLVESRSSSGGGKGRPRTVTYSYSASFAVALSARRVRSIGRIWADGKLLRGVAGDLKTPVALRLHDGDEDQAPDPLIAAAEGAGRAPAYRGLAYAVFENLPLEDYGNRIPSLSFEIEADEAAVPIGEVARALSGGEIAAGPTPALAGYAAAGASVRAAVEALADIVPLSLADRDGTLRIAAAPDDPIEIAAGEECAPREIVRRAEGSIAAEVSIAYYAPERDYQTGLQRATAGGSPVPALAERKALPAALSAAAAKALAEFRLAALRAGRTSARLRLGWGRAPLRPGDALRLPGEPGLWKLGRWTLGPMTLELELLRIGADALPELVAASPGRPVLEEDLRRGPTLLRLFDLPLGEPRGGQPLLFAAAAGLEPGWRRAALLSSFDGGASWQEAGATAAPAVMGIAETVLAPAGSALFDARSALEIELVHESMGLQNASDLALVGGANLALVGEELIQFGRAEWLDGRRFRLSRFLRGRRGTEWAAALHAAPEPFTLIDPDALVALEAPPGSAGAEARLSAFGAGDVEAAAASLAVSAESLRPPSPVHLRAERRSGGAIQISWVRRSRLGWAWPSGSDTPLGEESERYRLLISGAGFERTVTTPEPFHLYSTAEQAEDGAAAPIQLAVAQIGTWAESRPATILFA